MQIRKFRKCESRLILAYTFLRWADKRIPRRGIVSFMAGAKPHRGGSFIPRARTRPETSWRNLRGDFFRLKYPRAHFAFTSRAVVFNVRCVSAAMGLFRCAACAEAEALTSFRSSVDKSTGLVGGASSSLPFPFAALAISGSSAVIASFWGVYRRVCPQISSPCAPLSETSTRFLAHSNHARERPLAEQDRPRAIQTQLLSFCLRESVWERFFQVWGAKRGHFFAVDLLCIHEAEEWPGIIERSLTQSGG